MTEKMIDGDELLKWLREQRKELCSGNVDPLQNGEETERVENKVYEMQEGGDDDQTWTCAKIVELEAKVNELLKFIFDRGIEMGEMLKAKKGGNDATLHTNSGS